MMHIFRIVGAMLKASFIMMKSYRFNLFLGMIWGVVSLLMMVFMARLIDVDVLDAPGGVHYFTYIITGGIPMMVLNAAMTSMVSNIRSGQVSGTLETMLAGPIKLSKLMTATGLASLVRVYFRMTILLLIAYYALGAEIVLPQMTSLFILVLIVAVSFSGLGLMSAAFAIVYKKGDPIRMLVNGLFTFFGGVVFPAHLLPEYLQGISEWVPMTFATRSIRASLIEGAGWGMLWPDMQRLLFFGCITLPLGLWLLRWGLYRARKEGSLAQF